MGDRIDDEYGRELAKEIKSERQADVTAAGALLSGEQVKELKGFLQNQCWLKPAQAQEVGETIDQLAGEKGAKPLQVIKDALEGHVPVKFLNNDDNFKPIAGMIGNAIEAREARIEALHAKPENKFSAQVAAPKAGR